MEIYTIYQVMFSYNKKPPYTLTLQELEDLKKVLLSKTRYKALVPHITKVTYEYHATRRGRYAMLLAWSNHHERPIPLPKSEVKSNHSAKSRCLSRLRKQIEDQIQPLRKPGLHVDHVYPFEAIVQDWINQKKLDWGQVNKKKLYKEFAQYHKQVAKYQYLSPKENIKKGNKID